MSGIQEERAGRPTSILLVSPHAWFVSALRAVLEPEGFSLSQIRSARIAARDAALIDPDIVIIDEGLPDLEASALASTLSSGTLRPSVPILVYSPDAWHETAQADAVGAGAWDVLKEPIRSKLVVAKLKRLLEIKSLIDTTGEGVLSDPETGLFNLAGLLRMMRILSSGARRQETPLACAVLGPTKSPNRFEQERVRASMGELCRTHVRESDVVGWVSEADVGVLAMDTTAAGLAALVRRLTDRAGRCGISGAEPAISAGIVEIRLGPSGPEDSVDVRVAPVANKIASLSKLASAQKALREARSAGGGVRIAEGV